MSINKNHQQPQFLPSFPSALQLRVSFGLLNNLPLFFFILHLSSPSFLFNLRRSSCTSSNHLSNSHTRIINNVSFENVEDITYVEVTVNKNMTIESKNEFRERFMRSLHKVNEVKMHPSVCLHYRIRISLMKFY
jgi:hypothetical protein